MTVTIEGLRRKDVPLAIYSGQHYIFQNLLRLGILQMKKL